MSYFKRTLDLGNDETLVVSEDDCALSLSVYVEGPNVPDGARIPTQAEARQNAAWIADAVIAGAEHQDDALA